MHFASKKVYAKPSSSLFNRKDRNTNEAQIFIPPPPKANTNVISIDLGELKEKVKILTGDAATCQNCQAIFNVYSKTHFGKGGETVWKCEFCEKENNIMLEEEEIPKDQTCDYMLEPAPEGKEFKNDNTILFCIDISGSMCVTSEIVGKHKLKGDHTKDLASLNTEYQDQFLPGQRRDVTYVSRLQCVQAAIESQLDKLKKEYPQAKVGLICFNNEVTIIGDGTGNPVIIAGDKLSDQNALLELGSKCQITTPISTSKDSLITKLYQLSETGATALGPAIATAVGMVQNSPGSKIVLATDGLANLGVGALDFGYSNFYEELGSYAKSKAITISVIGIKGDNLNMNNIGKLADFTNGDVDIVDPLKIKDNFASILESKMVATDVIVKLFLHQGFEFPASDEWKKDNNPEKRQLYSSRNIGNAYEDTEITAEFQEASSDILSKIFDEKDGKKELPFQVQITYRDPSGMKLTRVITKMKEITGDAQEVEKEVDIAVLGMHSNYKQASLAQKGKVQDAIQAGEALNDLISKNISSTADNASYAAWSGQQERFKKVHQHSMQQPQQQMLPKPQPQMLQQQQMLQQPQMLQQSQPQQTSGFFGNFFSFGNSKPAQASPSFAPSPNTVPPPFSFSFGSSAPQGFSAASPNAPSSISLESADLDDEASTITYQMKNAQKNKKEWSSKRKY